MGILHIDSWNRLVIQSLFYFYGDAASEDIATKTASDIARYWNGPGMLVDGWEVFFDIQGFYIPGLAPETVWYNDDPPRIFSG